MGLFGMNKKEKAAIAINGYTVDTAKTRDEILKAINKDMPDPLWKNVQGAGMMNRANVACDGDIKPIISIDITDNANGTRTVRMWLSSDTRFPDIYYDLMEKIGKRL